MLSSIGEGAFGEVSLAACTIFGRVAVKWLKVQLLQLHGGPAVQRTPHLLHLGCTQAPCCSPASHCMAYSCIRSRAIVLYSLSTTGAWHLAFRSVHVPADLLPLSWFCACCMPHSIPQ